MGQDRNPPKGTPGLRERAEAKLSSQETGLQELPLEDMRALVHELQVHQIELEIQNDELRQGQIALEAANQKYHDFYEFAPVGFMTLDGAGIIREVNLTAVRQLETNQEPHPGQALDVFCGRRGYRPPPPLPQAGFPGIGVPTV